MQRGIESLSRAHDECRAGEISGWLPSVMSVRFSTSSAAQTKIVSARASKRAPRRARCSIKSVLSVPALDENLRSLRKFLVLVLVLRPRLLAFLQKITKRTKGVSWDSDWAKSKARYLCFRLPINPSLASFPSVGRFGCGGAALAIRGWCRSGSNADRTLPRAQHRGVVYPAHDSGVDYPVEGWR